MQNGVIYRKGSSWLFTWNVKELRGGKLQWVKRAKKLAPVCDQYRTIASVRHLAAEIMSPLNTRQARPESTQTVADFISLVSFPTASTLRASTAYGYRHLFNLIKPFLGDVQLRGFGPVEAEQLLHDFTSKKPRAHSQIKNMKHFISGTFRYAVRIGLFGLTPCGR